MSNKFSDDQIDFVRNNCKGKLNQELTDLFNNKFGTSFTKQQISNLKKRYKLSSGLNGIEFTFKKENVMAVFCDTLAEDGDLYRFLEDIENKFDIKIIRLCYGKTPMELAFEENFLYNSRVANCSKKLKSRIFNNWLKENFKEDECILYLGIDFTEIHRCEAIIRNYKPYKVEFPMCQQPYLYKHEMIEMLKEDGIDIPRIYKLGFQHNNCKGFCFKAGIGHYKNLYEKDRILYFECENKEQRIREKLGKDVSILKRKGKPFTLKQLRETLENQPGQLSLFECQDIGGCGCFVEGEE